MPQKHKYKESVVKNGYTVINCEDCGYWHVHPMPSEDELKIYYRNKYYETLSDNRSMTDKIDDPDGFIKITHYDKLRQLEKLLSPDLPRLVLDIGAGYGDFLSFMKTNGWKTQGLEPSKEAYNTAKNKKLNIKFGDLNNLLNLGLKPSSVVSLNNVLEHLREPLKVLEIIREHLLLPGGIVLILVPNDFNVLQDLLMKTVLKNNINKQYYWVAPLDHLNYWSAKTIQSFLKKCGFKILEFISDFPMELFPLMGEDYITYPKIGRDAHLKRVSFEKILFETKSFEFKDILFKTFAEVGVGRLIQIFMTPNKD